VSRDARFLAKLPVSVLRPLIIDHKAELVPRDLSAAVVLVRESP